MVWILLAMYCVVGIIIVRQTPWRRWPKYFQYVSMAAIAVVTPAVGRLGEWLDFVWFGT